MSRPYWDNQFAETAWERAERWATTKQKRIAEGKCWQCAKPTDECRCADIRKALGQS